MPPKKAARSSTGAARPKTAVKRVSGAKRLSEAGARGAKSIWILQNNTTDICCSGPTRTSPHAEEEASLQAWHSGIEGDSQISKVNRATSAQGALRPRRMFTIPTWKMNLTDLLLRIGQRDMSRAAGCLR